MTSDTAEGYNTSLISRDLSPQPVSYTHLFRDRLQAYAGHFWLMFDGETLISFVDGMVTDQPDLTDDLYENAALHSEDGYKRQVSRSAE